MPVEEVAPVLAELAMDSPSVLLHACRRLVEYFPASGQAWWLSARALAGPEPVEAVWEAAEELDRDNTTAGLARCLPHGAAVAVSPSTPVVAGALRRRPDVRSVKKLGAASVVLVSPSAASSGGLLVSSRTAAVLRAAKGAGKPVWAVVPLGVLLPQELWPYVVERAPSTEGTEEVGLEGIDQVVNAEGRFAVAYGLRRPGCAPVAELRGWKS